MTRKGGQERRRQLLESAVRLFGKQGFDSTTLDAVAHATGVTKQTLLYYFASKDALFDACVSEVSVHVAGVLERVLEGSDSGWARVESVVRGILRMAEEWPELPLFLREAARRSPKVVEQVASDLEPLRKRALMFLERGMEQGEFRQQDPGLLLFMLYTAIVGSLTEAGVLRAFAGRDSGTTALRKREEELIEFVRRALSP